MDLLIEPQGIEMPTIEEIKRKNETFNRTTRNWNEGEFINEQVRAYF